ncbi:zinc finger CCHC domain-containing protein 9 isoform X1 [Erpetoichthys calabaricus]|nr:zinc finger CCHC domain-containing protein 9 isoform X1 [Erpetoichthys calabaricus]
MTKAKAKWNLHSRFSYETRTTNTVAHSFRKPYASLNFQAMTRWARANNHRHKPSNATPWNQMWQTSKKANNGQGSSQLSTNAQKLSVKQNQQGGAIHKTKKKKKDYNNEDVNGFIDYLKQSGQPLPLDYVGVEAESEIFKEELSVALKKDKRKNDRRIKRQKAKQNNMICFKCRKTGHGLADCPQAEEDQDLGRGICYRCGSTEHEIHRCRAKIDPAVGEFPFAKCFICGASGHVSRSCPDNPKGVYSQGGSCRVCGSVEHFQKDCPENRSSGNSVTVGRWSNQMSADHEDIPGPVNKVKTKGQKIVTF